MIDKRRNTMGLGESSRGRLGRVSTRNARWSTALCFQSDFADGKPNRFVATGINFNEVWWCARHVVSGSIRR